MALLLAASILFFSSWHLDAVSAAVVVCKLEFVGFGLKGTHGLDRAILDCDAPSNEPILISINQTYLGSFVDNFKGVKVDDSVSLSSLLCAAVLGRQQAVSSRAAHQYVLDTIMQVPSPLIRS